VWSVIRVRYWPNTEEGIKREKKRGDEETEKGERMKEIQKKECWEFNPKCIADFKKILINFNTHSTFDRKTRGDIVLIYFLNEKN
jgi:hypothetical protein